MKRQWDIEELIEHFTLVAEDLELLANKTGPTRLGCALLLKCFQYEGRFPPARHDIPRSVVDYVAHQLKLDASLYAQYDWEGRTVKGHRTQICDHLGFREATNADTDEMSAWLVTDILASDQNLEHLKVVVTRHFRDLKIEPPTTERIERKERLSTQEMVVAVASDTPECFRQVTALYLDTYAARISPVYETLRHKAYSLAHFWHFIAEIYPEVRGCAEILPPHARAFIPYTIERGRRIQRRRAEETDDRVTACNWLITVRVFFADICTWATEPGSPFAAFAPRTIPLTRHDLVGVGFEQARKRSQARMTATIFDLEREMPKIRAYALRCWSEAEDALKQSPDSLKVQTAARDAFWDWALLELLVQSGLRWRKPVNSPPWISLSGACPMGGSTICSMSSPPSMIALAFSRSAMV